MRITALSVVFFAAGVMLAAETDTPYTRMAKLASSLSDGDSAGALESISKNATNYSTMAADIAAIASQDEVLCSIDVVTDQEAEDPKAEVHHLDLDWYMELKSRADSALVERRRERVAVVVKKFRDKWQITSLSPEKILVPVAVH